MSVIRSPMKIDVHVREFCSSINKNSKPIFMEVIPQEACIPLQCFQNVRDYVQKNGGRMQLGWTIWEWPGVFIEAEHHAVYDPCDGKAFIDITPTLDGKNRRLFLPDDEAAYNFDDEGVRRDNIRHALKKDPLITKFFHVATKRTEFMNSIPGIGEIHLTGAHAREYDIIEGDLASLQMELFKKYAGPNTPCICGSGLKYKKCHIKI